MEIKESAENYLETILLLKKTKSHVRSIDIVEHLGYSKPSVSVALKRLRENGYICVDDIGLITLTEAGKRIADCMFDRHTIISDFLIYLGVSEKTAKEDACKIEHVISCESFQIIRNKFTEIQSKNIKITDTNTCKCQRCNIRT